MNAADLVKAILFYSDQHTFAAAGSLYIRDALRRLNSAAQELYAVAPSWVTRRKGGGVLRAPVAVTISSAVQYSDTAGIISPWESWMAGCTIRIAGFDENRILSYTSSVSKFHLPLMSTGTLQAIVYGDSFALPAGALKVLRDPRIPGVSPLMPFTGPSEAFRVVSDYGRLSIIDTTSCSPGTPFNYAVESQNDGAAITRRFAVRPLPDRDYLVDYRYTIAPPEITEADLDVAGEGAACTKTIPVPDDWHDLYLLPIAIQRYTASPLFTKAELRAEIARQYSAALDALRSMNPQEDVPVRFIPGM